MTTTNMIGRHRFRLKTFQETSFFFFKEGEINLMTSERTIDQLLINY